VEPVVHSDGKCGQSASEKIVVPHKLLLTVDLTMNFDSNYELLEILLVIADVRWCLTTSTSWKLNIGNRWHIVGKNSYSLVSFILTM